MTIENLTDEDLAWLRNDTRPTGPKALRIIDAQAAVIEKVRANAAEIHESLEDILDALAAAPEQVILTRVRRDVIDIQARDLAATNTRVAELRAELDAERERTAEERTLRISDIADANARVAELEESNAAGWAIAKARVEALNAANARVAELEESEARAVARAKDIEAECVRVERRVIAANARAEAAERELKKERDRRVEHRQMNQTLNEALNGANARIAELEAACYATQGSLREASARADAAETGELRETRNAERWAEMCKAAESEAETLRALLGQLGHWADGYGSALVPHGGWADTFGDGVRCCKAQVKAMLPAETRSHLSGQGPTRTDHERAVLDACADAVIFPAVPGLHGPCFNGGEWRIVHAELARREAKLACGGGK